MLREIDEQLTARCADIAIVPVGVGSLAQAVVAHAKAAGRSTLVITVEPDTAACLRQSLSAGHITPVGVSPQAKPSAPSSFCCTFTEVTSFPTLYAH